MPHSSARIVWRFVPLALLALSPLSQTANAADSATLAWHAPAADRALVASENISRTVHWGLNAVLMKLAAGRADPVTILEDRSQTLAFDRHGPCVVVRENDTRRYGGEHPKDASVVRRMAQAMVRADPIGRWGLLPPLGAADLAPSTASPSPSGSASAPTTCSFNDNNDPQLYKDAGDAALAEMPATPIAVGQSWTFHREVRVERELASGTMTYTDQLQRIEERAGHRVAIIHVSGIGRMNVVKDLQNKGFRTASMSFDGSAEFDLAQGVPLTQRYIGHVEWDTHILGAHVGLIVDETYDGKPWTATASS